VLFTSERMTPEVYSLIYGSLADKLEEAGYSVDRNGRKRKLERTVALGALRSGVFRRRPLIVSLPALERLFIASTVGRRHRTRATAQT
jgi:hypothetical protein